MSFDAQRLFELLPMVYRIRDAQRNGPSQSALPPATEMERLKSERQTAGPLKALLWVIADQIAIIEEDLAQLYDDQFIETCAEWVVPYIAELIGHPVRQDIAVEGISPRAQVANTIRYRRRKGTSSMLEQLARDATNWDARVVEFFERLSCTQHVNHPRPGSFYSPDLRHWEPLERVNTAFDRLGHTIDVRGSGSGTGKYGVSIIGVFLWRLKSCTLTKSTALGVSKLDERGGGQRDHRQFLFHPLGLDTQLFTNPVSEDQIAHLAEPINVSMPISHVVLQHCLEQYYGRDRSVLIEARENNAAPYREVPAADIEVRNLSGWEYVPGEKKVAVDPVLGRMVFGVDQKSPPRVTFCYGFSDDVGGGEYDRFATFEPRTRPVNQDPLEVSETKYNTIQEALTRASPGGSVKICDNRRYEEELKVSVAKDARVELRAANACRPTILCDTFLIDGEETSEVTLNGLVISGRLSLGRQLRQLRLRHCTLVPTAGPSLIVDDPGIVVEIDHCITGQLEINRAAKVRIIDSIVDGAAAGNNALAGKPLPGKQFAASNTTLSVLRSTVLGRVRVHTIDLAENSIFDGWVRVARQQAGCMQFCYTPFDSRTPRRYRCQPDLSREAEEEERDGGPGATPGPSRERIDLHPRFESVRHGQPGYCQLSRHCCDEIRRGAEDNSEMGVFHDLFQPQREDVLKARLERYARIGTTTNLFFVT